MAATGDAFPMPLGPRPEVFLALMAAIGLFASWLGTLCWNEASQRLPTALVGQLIVFETLAALAYAYMLRGQMPQPLTLIGIGCLIVGVLRAVRVKASRWRRRPRRRPGWILGRRWPIAARARSSRRHVAGLDVWPAGTPAC